MLRAGEWSPCCHCNPADYRERTVSLRVDHRALDSTLQSLHRWPLCVWASVHEEKRRDKGTDRRGQDITCNEHINFASVHVTLWLSEHHISLRMSLKPSTIHLTSMHFLSGVHSTVLLSLMTPISGSLEAAFRKGTVALCST